MNEGPSNRVHWLHARARWWRFVRFAGPAAALIATGAFFAWRGGPERTGVLHFQQEAVAADARDPVWRSPPLAAPPGQQPGRGAPYSVLTADVRFVRRAGPGWSILAAELTNVGAGGGWDKAEMPGFDRWTTKPGLSFHEVEFGTVRWEAVFARWAELIRAGDRAGARFESGGSINIDPAALGLSLDDQLELLTLAERTPRGVLWPRRIPERERGVPVRLLMLAGAVLFGAAAGVSAVLTTVRAVGRTRVRLRARAVGAGRCPGCGYAAAGLAPGAVCPECGADPEVIRAEAEAALGPTPPKAAAP